MSGITTFGLSISSAGVTTYSHIPPLSNAAAPNVATDVANAAIQAGNEPTNPPSVLKLKSNDRLEPSEDGAHQKDHKAELNTTVSEIAQGTGIASAATTTTSATPTAMKEHSHPLPDATAAAMTGVAADATTGTLTTAGAGTVTAAAAVLTMANPIDSADATTQIQVVDLSEGNPANFISEEEMANSMDRCLLETQPEKPTVKMLKNGNRIIYNHTDIEVSFGDKVDEKRCIIINGKIASIEGLPILYGINCVLKCYYEKGDCNYLMIKDADLGRTPEKLLLAYDPITAKVVDCCYLVGNDRIQFEQQREKAKLKAAAKISSNPPFSSAASNTSTVVATSAAATAQVKVTDL